MPTPTCATLFAVQVATGPVHRIADLAAQDVIDGYTVVFGSHNWLTYQSGRTITTVRLYDASVRVVGPVRGARG